MLSGNGEHQNCANRRQYTCASNDQPLALCFCRDPARSDDGNDLDDAKWDVEENRLKATVPKGLDNQISKSRDAATGNSATCVRL